MMNNKALVVIDIQNDITKHYRDIISNINAAIEWATATDIIRHIFLQRSTFGRFLALRWCSGASRRSCKEYPRNLVVSKIICNFVVDMHKVRITAIQLLY